MNTMYLAHVSLTFFALAMAILSAWVKRSPWVWGTFLVFAFILGYFTKILTPVALLPIGGLFVAHAFLKGDIKGLPRFILVVVAAALSAGLLLHKFPGFNNWKVVSNLVVSKGAKPINIFFNFDKPFIGLFILVLGFPLISNPRQFTKLLKTAIPLTLCGLAILIPLALFSGLVKWDPKWTPWFWLFAINNLIFVTIIEEAFWRGFLQVEIFRFFGRKGFLASCLAVILTAALFAALHLLWSQNIYFLGLIFVAGIVYGTIFQYTKALEASILAHFTFNITHFLLFTYPFVMSSSS